jgi:hypothetical protein
MYVKDKTDKKLRYGVKPLIFALFEYLSLNEAPIPLLEIIDVMKMHA